MLSEDATAATTSYDAAFFASLREGSRRSAKAVIPHVLELVRPRSVIDVGAGTGAWVEALRREGVADVLGVDGDWVPREELDVPPEHLMRADLTRPLPIERTFDLVISLEVAEHLPLACAAQFVETLTRLAPVALFSAAIPGQTGKGHLNEQWPGYWAELFSRHDFMPVDALRPLIWEDKRVEWWYRQNAVFFVARGALPGLGPLERLYAEQRGRLLSVVHPTCFRHALATAGRHAEGQ